MEQILPKFLSYRLWVAFKPFFSRYFITELISLFSIFTTTSIQFWYHTESKNTISTVPQNFFNSRHLVWPWPVLEADRVSELPRFFLLCNYQIEPGSSRSILDFGQRNKSHGDVPSLECCFSPNNTSQIARCGLERYPDKGSKSLIFRYPQIEKKIYHCFEFRLAHALSSY